VGVPKSILGRYAPTAHIEDGSLFVVLKAYFDRSGQESAVFVTLSGIAANDNTWAQIEDMWRGILSDHNPQAEYMHMVEAVPLRDPFSKEKGWDDEKVFGLINLLLSYLTQIPKTTYCQFSCTVDMGAYRRLRAETYAMDAPVDICNTACVERVMFWYLHEYKGVDLEAHYYFDQGEPFEPSFKAKWERETERDRDTGTYSIWSHIKHVGSAIMRQTPGLQIADMLAWASNRKEAKLSQRYQELFIPMSRLIPCKWITWDETNLRTKYRPLIYRPYDRNQI
jgi:hypothetical protein